MAELTAGVGLAIGAPLPVWPGDIALSAGRGAGRPSDLIAACPPAGAHSDAESVEISSAVRPQRASTVA
jgi:hypothetical protein